MPKPPPIKQRILDAAQAAGGRIDYYKLMAEVFPVEQFPKAFRYQQNGGPPGCAMPLGRALRELCEAQKIYDSNPRRGTRTIQIRSSNHRNSNA